MKTSGVGDSIKNLTTRPTNEDASMLKPSRFYATYYRIGDQPWTRVRPEPQPKEQAEVDRVIRSKAGWEAVVVEHDECPECGDDAMENIHGSHQCGTCCFLTAA